MSGRQVLAGVSAATLLCAAAGMALASGGGGGGMSPGMGMGSGGGAPSMSAPRYNAVEEYRNGLAALQSSDYRTADKDFSHVLEVDPKDADTLFGMGLAKAGEKDPKSAAKFYDRALKADGQHIGARRELAITDVQLGEPDKAKVELAALQARASACGDTCPDAQQLKASVAAVQAAITPAGATAATASPAGPADAAPAPAASSATTPGPSAALDRSGLLFATSKAGDHNYVTAVHLINEHRYADALRELRAAQLAFGPHPDVLTYIGYVNRKLGHLDEAEAYYREALNIYPDHVGATEYYGELKVIRGDIAGARKMLAKLEQTCTFGCIEEDDLRRWIDAGHDPF